MQLFVTFHVYIGFFSHQKISDEIHVENITKVMSSSLIVVINNSRLSILNKRINIYIYILQNCTKDIGFKKTGIYFQEKKQLKSFR